MWNYDGILEQGKLHGQGMLTFNGIRIGGTKWVNNLQEDSIIDNQHPPQQGYYMAVPQRLFVGHCQRRPQTR